jgi:4-hydroxy-tetrahydrodipicolinate reductase
MSEEELLALDADCVIYTPGMYDMADPGVPGSNTHEMYQTALRILASGKNVATTVCPLIDPCFLADGKRIRDEIEAACAKGNTTFFATGFEPGFMGDVLPLTLASTCGVVTKFTATEVLDCFDFTAFETLRAMGFGRPPEELSSVGLEGVRVTWGSVPYMAARGLGVEIEDVKIDADVYLAPETFQATGGTIEKGTIAALRFRVIGIVGGEPKIVLQHIDRMRADMAPDWAQVEPAGGYMVEIEGTNPLKAVFQLGLPGSEGGSFRDAMAMTAARCVNSVEAVVQAPPGFKTFFDLPPLTGKYTMHP